MQHRGLFETLFDLDFSDFLTASLIPVIYGLILAVVVVVGVISFARFLFGGQLVMAIIVPVQMILTLVVTRVALEGVLCLFRIAEHAKGIRDRLESTPQA